MSIGKMNRTINIISDEPVKDAEGFVTKGFNVLATVRACKGENQGNEKQASMAVFSSETVLFRFRKIPGIAVDTSMAVTDDGERFNIVSVNNEKGRGMYIEVLAEKVEGSS